MPSTQLSLHYHVVFSTKDRTPVIAAAWRERLHAYLGGVVRNVEGEPEAIGGIARQEEHHRKRTFQEELGSALAGSRGELLA